MAGFYDRVIMRQIRLCVCVVIFRDSPAYYRVNKDINLLFAIDTRVFNVPHSPTIVVV